MGLSRNALAIGSVFCLLAVIQSAFLALQHVRNWTKPAQQRKILIIVAMVPIFALNSLASLMIMRSSKKVGQHTPEWVDMVLDGFKECYEACVIWSFLELMLCYTDCLAKPGFVPDGLKGKELHLPAPLPWFCGTDHWVFDAAIAEKLRWWTLQFVYVRPVMSIAIVAVTALGIYEHIAVWLPVSLVLNVSVTIAVYALMLFYHAFQEQLSQGYHRPLAKFLCIKGVVFFIFWQGIVVEVLEATGFIKTGKFFDLAEKSTIIQDALVCLEMGLLFAPLNAYSFSYLDYIQADTEAKKNK